MAQVEGSVESVLRRSGSIRENVEELKHSIPAGKERERCLTGLFRDGINPVLWAGELQSSQGYFDAKELSKIVENSVTDVAVQAQILSEISGARIELATSTEAGVDSDALADAGVLQSQAISKLASLFR